MKSAEQKEQNALVQRKTKRPHKPRMNPMPKFHYVYILQSINHPNATTPAALMTLRPASSDTTQASVRIQRDTAPGGSTWPSRSDRGRRQLPYGVDTNSAVSVGRISNGAVNNSPEAISGLS